MVRTFIAMARGAKEVGLRINKNKTKYMLATKGPANLEQLEIGQFKFEKLESFANLGTYIIKTNDVSYVVKKSITQGNTS